MLHTTGKERQLLLIALRHALFGNAYDPDLFKDCDWTTFFKIAQDHTVACIALDGINNLPDDIRPKINILGHQCMRMMAVEQANRKINKDVIGITELLSENNFSPIIIKGQIAANDYPNPLHREPGDIDVWIADTTEAEKAFKWAARNFKCRWMPGEKETSFTWNASAIELHRRIADMQYPPYQKFLQKTIARLLSDNKTRQVDIDGHIVKAMPLTLSMIHQLLHLEYHILREGIGLRQFCDLAVFLHRHSSSIINEHSQIEIQQILNDCGIGRISAAIGYILHKQLGIAEDRIPFQISAHGADIILEDIWNGGNFGKNRVKDISEYGFFRRKIAMLPIHFSQYRRYRHLLPNEAFTNFLSKFLRAAKGIK